MTTPNNINESKQYSGQYLPTKTTVTIYITFLHAPKQIMGLREVKRKPLKA